MVVIVTPLLVAIVGLLIYALSSSAKLAEIGRLMFFAGLLTALFVFGQGHIHLP